MRYFCYTNPYEFTIVIMDEDSDGISFYPLRTDYSFRKTDWLQHYKSSKGDKMFEICEGQYKKMIEKGIKPTNWDW